MCSKNPEKEEMRAKNAHRRKHIPAHFITRYELRSKHKTIINKMNNVCEAKEMK